MKTMKRFGSLLLVLALALALAVPAFAEEETGSITIENAPAGQTYTIYRLLILESYDNETESYLYRPNPAWWAVMQEYVDYTTDSAGETVVTGLKTKADGTKYTAEEVAAAARDDVDAHTNDGTHTVGGTSEKVVFDNLPLGYYLVDSSLGALCSLDTTIPDVVMKEKNEAASISKLVWEGTDENNGNWADTNDVAVGETIKYQATIKVPKNTVKLVMHDALENTRMVFDGITSVQAGSTEYNATVVAGANDYSLVTAINKTPAHASCTFDIEFKQDYIDNLPYDEETGVAYIVVEYTAHLAEGNPESNLTGDDTPEVNYNKTWVTFGDNATESAEALTKTFTYWIDVLKYTAKDGEEIGLAGAEFKLTTDEAGEKALEFHYIGNDLNGTNDRFYYMVCCDEDCAKKNSHTTVIQTEDNGKVNIDGLDSDTYYLFETKAPAGYNLLDEAVDVDLTRPTKDVNGYLVLAAGKGDYKVLNQAGALLPATGGVGTTIFYVLGGCLAVGAGVLLVTKKRMGVEE